MKENPLEGLGKLDILVALENDIELWKYVPEELRHDSKFMYLAVIECPELINYVSEKLLHDLGFMYSLVDKNHKFMKHAADELLNNFDFIQLVIWKHPENFKYVPEKLLRKLRNFIEKKIDDGPDSENAIKKIMIEGIDYSPILFKYLPKQLCTNQPYLIEVISKNPKLIEYLPKRLRNNKNFMNLINGYVRSQ